MKKDFSKLQQLSFTELYDIFNFLKFELETVDDYEKEILSERIKIVEEELKRIVNNLF
jgi:hypothetical protein